MNAARTCHRNEYRARFWHVSDRPGYFLHWLKFSRASLAIGADARGRGELNGRIAKAQATEFALTGSHRRDGWLV